MVKTFSWEKANSEIVNTTSVKEFHDYCDVVEVSRHTGQTGKISVKLLFSTKDGGKFASYMGIVDRAGEITVQRLVKLLVKAVGEESAKRIFDKVANDEDINTDKEFILELANKVNNKVTANPVKVYADRVKNGDNWQVKWYFDKPQTSNAAEDVAKANDDADAIAKVLEGN